MGERRRGVGLRLLLHTDAVEVGGAVRALATLAGALHAGVDVTVLGEEPDVVEAVVSALNRHRRNQHVVERHEP